MLLPFFGPVRRPYSRLVLNVTDASLSLEADAALSPEDASPAPVRRVFALDDLRLRPWWKDCNVAGLTLTGAALPVRAECLEPRQYELSWVNAARPDVAVLLYVPDTEAVFTDMAVTPLLGPDTELVCNLPVDDTLTPEERARTKVARVMPRLRLSGPDAAQAESRVVCSVEARLNGEPYPGLLDVHLECVNGFLPKTRLRAADAPVSFSVLTTGLEAGDTIKVKAGFRYMTAQAEHLIRIVAPGGEAAEGGKA